MFILGFYIGVLCTIIPGVIVYWVRDEESLTNMEILWVVLATIFWPITFLYLGILFIKEVILSKE